VKYCTISFETFVETGISCCVPRFLLILTAKFHSLYVKESESEILERSELGVGNFAKSESGIGVGYFTSDSATLVVTSRPNPVPCVMQNDLTVGNTLHCQLHSRDSFGLISETTIARHF